MDIALLMETKRDALALAMIEESVKRSKDAYGEVDASIANFKWYSEEIKRIYPEMIPSKNGSTQMGPRTFGCSRLNHAMELPP